MKILYLTYQRGDLGYGEIADYQSDMLFHGLRELLGQDITDYPKKTHLYKGFPNTQNLWGKGFTYTNTLDDIPVDRDECGGGKETIRKIEEGYFDLIVMSVHHTLQHFANGQNQVLEILKSNPKNKIAVVDGHDLPHYNRDLKPNWFFKREIYDDNPDLIPINFAIPECKIVKEVPTKIKDFADILPASTESHWPQENRSTHKYNTEEEYYQDYKDARFAFTCKKGGWDCMRHYEIMANGCIPLFTDIENCPLYTLTNLPCLYLSWVKTLSRLNIKVNNSRTYSGDKLIKNNYSFNTTPDDNLESISELCLNYTSKLSTKNLAKYFLDKCK